MHACSSQLLVAPFKIRLEIFGLQSVRVVYVAAYFLPFLIFISDKDDSLPKAAEEKHSRSVIINTKQSTHYRFVSLSARGKGERTERFLV